MWLGIVGFLTLVLKKLGFDYNKNFILFSLYFILWSMIGTSLFKTKELIRGRFQKSNFIYLFFAPTLVCFLLTLLVEYKIPLSPEQVSVLNDIGLMFPLFNVPTFVAKFADIIFQQIMIFSLVLGLDRQGYSHPKIMKYFTIAFLGLHIPLIFIFKLYGLLFIAPAGLAGYIFSFLVLKFKNGLLLSILVHQVFYLVLGTVLRFYL